MSRRRILIRKRIISLLVPHFLKGLCVVIMAVATSSFASAQAAASKKATKGEPCAAAQPQGFETAASDPKKAKLTQAYEYWWTVPGGKEKGIYLEHDVAKITYKDGKLTLGDAGAQVLTGYKILGKKITVTFKSITQTTSGASCGLINVLTLESSDG